MFQRLNEEDFAVLRGPLESGRQSPDSLAFALVLAIFLQALLYFLTYNVAGASTIFPYLKEIQTIHFWLTALLILLSVFYAIPLIYRRSQRIQYALSILTIQNIGALSFYLIAIFIIGEQAAISVESVIMVTKITLVVALLLFISVFVRFYILLRNGHYRTGSKKGRLRDLFEFDIEMKTINKIITIVLTIFGALVVMITKIMGSDNFEDTFLIMISLAIFYTMIFVLPEQLVILYCKIRFKSFNFDKRGYLLELKERSMSDHE